MTTIRQFFEARTTKPTAAYLRFGNRSRPDQLWYHEGDGPIPPTVYVIEALTEAGIDIRDDVLVNATSSWLNTYRNYECNWTRGRNLNWHVELKKVAPKMSRWDQFSLDKLGAKPNLGSIYNEITNIQDSMARQIYMLAAFCILYYKGSLKSYKSGGHNIGSILVSDDGEILSWGVNDGEYRHAEVNTLINYFVKNPGQARLPKRSVLFTTLKPCQMCSTYIKERWDAPGETRVYYGMYDTGSSGSTPMLGSLSKELEGGAPLGECIYPQPDPKAYLGFGEGMTVGTSEINVTQSGKSVGLTKALNQSSLKDKPQRMMVSDWVDDSKAIKDLFDSAYDVLAGRSAFIGPVNKEQARARDVVMYVRDWVL
jgi:tRNA(Arg) A34 adenosine deaminase TadA